MSALKSAMRLLPAAFAVSLLTGCAAYKSAWEAQNGMSRPHNNPSVAQTGAARNDGDAPTPAASSAATPAASPAASPDAAEPKPVEQPREAMKPAAPVPDAKADREAPEKADRDRAMMEKVNRDAGELETSARSDNARSERPVGVLSPEAESMRSWTANQRRLDHMLRSANDDHLVAIMLSTDNVDLSFARMGYSRASAREVKAFAQRMINDHSQAVALVNEIVSRHDISPKDNLMSRNLRDEATTQRELLRPLTGRAFDSAYVANEVAYHRHLLTIIDDVLLPRLEEGELRQQLVTMRPVLSAHLAHAEQLQATLEQR